MCGGYTITKNLGKMEARFNAKLLKGSFEPRFNARPTQNLPIITNDNPKEIQMAHWGIEPQWAKSPIINTRSDSDQKPTFKMLFEKQRCLVLADGFYEWKKEKKGKIPYRFILKNEEPFAMAGLWEKDDEGVTHFTIITTDPNELTGQIHNRMPAILSRESESSWIHTKVPLMPYPSEPMTSYEVSKEVNNASNDYPDLTRHSLG